MRSEKRFDFSAISAILWNEAYIGDRLIQKAAPRNFLTKKSDPMEAYDSYYIRDDHEAIVSRDTWEKAHARLLKEKEYIEFLVGRDGEFDRLTASVIP